MKAALVTEEAIGSLISHGNRDGKVRVTVRIFLGTVTIDMSAPGSEYNLTEAMSSATLPLEGEDLGYEAQEVIGNILLRTMAEDLKYRHKDGRNLIRITVVRSKKSFLYVTLGALVAAIVVGILLSMYGSSGLNETLNRFIFVPLKTVYLNALRMIVAPVVFFSIVSCISSFPDLSDLGKIGGKVISLYALSACIAVIIGIGVFYLVQPGQPLPGEALTEAVEAAEVNLSVKDLLMGVVPSNFLNPFLTDNMIQLIFLAVLCGIATGLIGEYSATLKALFQALNELFLKVAGLIIRFMPLAVFCSVISMITDMGVETMISVAGMFGTFLLGIAIMMIVYVLMIIFLGKLDPRPFIRKYTPVMLQVFSVASSNAAIPLNMEACASRLGISPKVYSLGIPLGATVNMSGTCIQQIVFALALAKAFGVPVSGSQLLTLGMTVLVLSAGTPGIPGAGVICLSVLLQQLGVPTEGVGMVMGIGPILGMFLCMVNCLGDVVASTIVARRCGEMNMDVYSK